MQDGKRVVTRYLEEIVNLGRFEVADELLAEDFVTHTAGGGVGSGRDGFVDSLRALRTAFPDWTVTVHAMIAEGDLVSDHPSVRATHSGQAGGRAPSGETMAGELMHLWRLSGGRLAEGGTLALPSSWRRSSRHCRRRPTTCSPRQTRVDERDGLGRQVSGSCLPAAISLAHHRALVGLGRGRRWY